MNDENRTRQTVDAPELGALVELVEASVGDVLPLITMVESGNSNADLILGTLAASLRIDGRQLTRAEIEGMGARKLRTLMLLGPRALAVNGFGNEEDAEKKG